MCQSNGTSLSCAGCPLVSDYSTRTATLTFNQMCMCHPKTSKDKKINEIKIRLYLCSEFIKYFKNGIDEKFNLKIKEVKA